MVRLFKLSGTRKLQPSLLTYSVWPLSCYDPNVSKFTKLDRSTPANVHAQPIVPLARPLITLTKRNVAVNVLTFSPALIIVLS